MLKTLHGYILRELVRTTILALAALTLLMTVLAIIEPMRRQGLSGGQVVQLFGYTLPAMLSFTLPFASLFAATIVYGRFAMDREMLACRASGVSQITMLQPAIWLGVSVTLLTLLLSNVVAPIMLRKSQDTIFQNIKGIVYHKLKSEGYIDKIPKVLIHASQVDEENDILIGIVGGPYEVQTDVRDGVARKYIQAAVGSTAQMKIQKDPITDQYYISVFPTELTGPVSNHVGGRGLQGREVPLTNIELPSPAEDDPKFYDWPDLIATLADPSRHGDIRKELRELETEVRQIRSLERIARLLKTGKPLTLTRAGLNYTLTAPSVSVSDKKKQITLASGTDENGVTIPIVYTKPNGTKTYAHRAVLETTLPEIRRQARLKLTFKGNVSTVAMEGREPVKRETRGSEVSFDLPPDPAMPIVKTPAEHHKLLSQLYNHPEEFSQNQIITERINGIKAKRPRKIQDEVIAEMNGRLAYGLSPLLLVVMGGILGIVLRSGQMLTAFAVAAAPATLTFILILMGQKMITNSGSSNIAGLILIWSGLVIVAAADAFALYKVGRQ